MERTMPAHVIALALLVASEAAFGARQAILLAVLLPLTGAVLLLDGRTSRGARIALARVKGGKEGAQLR
jgi:hypothetical protein